MVSKYQVARRLRGRAPAHRRAQRGAAMVEAAFMMPMFVILFFTSLYAHNMGSKQIAVNMQSRSDAWAFSMSNCLQPSDDDEDHVPTGVGAGTVFPLSDTGQNETAGVVSGSGIASKAGAVAAPVTAAISDILPNPQGARGFSQNVISWRQPNLYSHDDPTRQTTIQQTVIIVCNQQPITSNLVTALKEVICVVSGKAC